MKRAPGAVAVMVLVAGCASPTTATSIRMPEAAELSDTAPTAIVRAKTDLPVGTEVSASYQLGTGTAGGNGDRVRPGGLIVIAVTNPACFRPDEGPIDGFEVTIRAGDAEAQRHYDWPKGICDRVAEMPTTPRIGLVPDECNQLTNFILDGFNPPGPINFGNVVSMVLPAPRGSERTQIGWQVPLELYVRNGSNLELSASDEDAVMSFRMPGSEVTQTLSEWASYRRSSFSVRGDWERYDGWAYFPRAGCYEFRAEWSAPVAGEWTHTIGVGR